jgi:hypothetical protein
VKVVATTKTTHNPFNETHRVSCLRENLTSSSDGEGLETGCALSSVPRQSFTRQNWWKWVKQMFKIKRPLGESDNALPVQIVSASVTDLLLRAFKHSSGFTSSLYEFVSNYQELSLVPLKELTKGILRRALETIFRVLETPRVLKVLRNFQLDGVFHMGQD